MKPTRTALYYFTGTGNSLHIARSLTKALPGSEVIAMASCLSSSSLVSTAETIGFVHPLYWYGLPGLVRRFLQRVDLQSSRYTFSVVTCEVPGGLGHRQTSDLLRARGWSLDAAFYMAMPNNYILGAYQVTPEIERNERFRNAERKVDLVVKAVAERRRLRESAPLSEAWFGLRKRPERKHRAWLESARTWDAAFVVQASCDGCGVCARVCPVNNILMAEGRPRWQHHCEQCLACIHHCPQEAIQYGEETSDKARYRNPYVPLADIIAQKSIAG